MVLARAVNDPNLADELRDSTRTAVLREASW
jgi:hypothetical protein